MTAAMAKFKQLLEAQTLEDRLSNQQWLSLQARYRAEDIQARQRAKLVADIHQFRARNAPHIF